MLQSSISLDAVNPTPAPYRPQASETEVYQVPSTDFSAARLKRRDSYLRTGI